MPGEEPGQRNAWRVTPHASLWPGPYPGQRAGRSSAHTLGPSGTGGRGARIAPHHASHRSEGLPCAESAHGPVGAARPATLRA